MWDAIETQLRPPWWRRLIDQVILSDWHFWSCYKEYVKIILIFIVNAFVSTKLHAGKATYFKVPAEWRTVWENPPLTGGGSLGHKQRRVGDYLLFKQIAGPVWPQLQRPLNPAPPQLFKSPSEGTGVLLRNKELLGQNSLGSQGGLPVAMQDPFADWLANMQNILEGADAWVVWEIAKQPCN